MGDIGDDIKSTVSAGIVTEAQAASLLAHVQSRQGQRDHMAADDEPFEFFRGFAEIFVTVGLSLLLVGLFGVAWFATSSMMAGILLAGTSAYLARYYTLKRRMTLPSMMLSIATVGGALTAVFALLDTGFAISKSTYLYTFAAGAVICVLYFMIYRLPFVMFLFGLNVLGLIYAAATDVATLYAAASNPSKSLFDLGTGSSFAVASLIYGFGMMVLGLWFDMRDPHRISRYSATGFWLHILAAPALVNTGAMSLYNLGGTTGYLLTAALLIAVTFFALIVDRRSFLTAGVFYFIAIISWAANETMGATTGTASVIFIIGAFFTAIGTWWIQIRARIMQALPDFPGKYRLPPYHINDRGLND